MKAGLTSALITSAALFASPVLADKAVPRGGGSSSSGSSKGSSSSSSSSSKSSSAKSSSGSSSSASSGVPRTDAQRRHPRPGTGSGDRWGGRRHGYGGGYWPRYYGGYHGGYYNSYWGSRYGYRYGWYPYSYWGYSPYAYSGYYGYSPYAYHARRPRYSRQEGALRVIVEPNKTRVFVDGYYAGVADDFDGLLQRLYLPTGRHDISLKLDGYRTQHFRVYVPYDQTVKIHHDMVEGDGEATSDHYAGMVDVDDRRSRDHDDVDWDDDRDRRDRDDDGRDGGVVRLDISPRDATVYVDGEFHGSAGERLRLPAGRHRIEVVRPGYRTVEREIEVRRGRSNEVRIEMERM